MQKIIIFGCDDETTSIVCHGLSEQVEVRAVVLEDGVPRTTVFRRRAKRLGLLRALGQALFVVLVTPVLHALAKTRTREICKNEELDTRPIADTRIVHVDSINDEAVADLVKKESPDAVVVFGTRLLSKKLLSAIEVPLINLHLGWNPTYRGGNGAYWALAEGDPEHCGVTVHLIDAGVDTGAVLERRTIQPAAQDTFVTYPYLQLAEGTRALIDVLKRDALVPTDTEGERSAMWYHPTAWGYLWRRLTKGVK